MVDFKWNDLIGLFAYDGGATDSGIHDEVLRAELIAGMKAMSEDEFRLGMSRFVQEHFLSEDALAKRYGIEDVVEFVRWLGDYMETDI